MIARLRRVVAALALLSALTVAAPRPADAYAEAGWVLVHGYGGRSCWLYIEYRQSPSNDPQATAIAISSCSVEYPNSWQVLVNFGQWPWSVVGGFAPASGYTTVTATTLNIEADGACARVSWAGSVSSWGCINYWT